MTLPADHPQRLELNDEVHARPAEPLRAPTRLSHLTLHTGGAHHERGWQAVRALALRYGVAAPVENAIYARLDLGPFRLKWERHTEFVRATFIVDGQAADKDGEADPFDPPAIAAVPEDWLVTLPGQVMVAAHAALIGEAHQPVDVEGLAGRMFGGNTVIGSQISGRLGTALTDFRVRADGFSRILVLDHGMRPTQAGRAIQRLLDIETYRMMALLALPVARALGPFLTQCEQELAEITAALVGVPAQEEPALLARLTQLAAKIERRQSGNPGGDDNLFRFGAAAAYYELVRRRITELREHRIEGLQTFQEFTERRLAPAMNTCLAVAGRQQSLSQRVARATQLLSTRVDVTREQQNQAVLASMDRRAALQLRLQETVEGLSVAAVTYYIVGLIGHAAEAAHAVGLPIDPVFAMGGSIPIVAILTALGVRRIRRMVSHDH